MKTIDQVKAYCVINTVTMELVSQFYRREGDAKALIAKNAPKPWCTEEYKAKYKFAVAEFGFDKYYVVE